jgi:redox-sensitive bicupin YhaK (pirin superfamily)
MSKTVLHKADTRGSADHGWLHAKHSFSFANYYDPNRMHFGALRVLNDDIVDPGMGFGMHPHDNMEIITIPLEGELQHKDNMGNTSVIKHGDIQVMSAGTGVTHSEFNPNKEKPVKLLQIWVFPNKKGVKPRYGEMTMNLKDRENKLQQLVSPNENDAGLWVHQDTWFHLGKFEKGKEVSYELRKKGNGIYAFVISGDASIEGQQLHVRDGFGIWETDKINIKADSDMEILLMEVPMQ